jgi:hypothetical protein
MMSVASARFDPRVEAALLSHYGVDVHDRQAVSLRRLRVLLACLPPEVWRDPGHWRDPWSQTDYLLAAVVDEQRAMRWLTAFGLSRKKPSWKPEPVTRPEDPAKAKAKAGARSAWMQLAKMLGGGARD